MAHAVRNTHVKELPPGYIQPKTKETNKNMQTYKPYIKEEILTKHSDTPQTKIIVRKSKIFAITNNIFQTDDT